VRRALEITAGLALALLAWRASGALLPAAAPPPEPPGDSGARGSPPAPASALEPADPSGAEPTLREQADPIASYALRVSLDPDDHALRGEGTIAWRNASSEPQRELFVHLYLNAFKTDRTVFARGASDGFRGSGGVRDAGWIEVEGLFVRELGEDVWPAGATTDGDPDDATDIRVPLPRAVLPGESLTIDVAWRARLPSVTLRTGFDGSFHMVGQWFPKLARLRPDGSWAHFAFHRLSEFYADFGSYDVTVDVPEAFTVGATGELVAESRSGGRVFRTFVQDDVHDFAFAAWDRFEEARETTADGVELRCLYPKGHERAAAVEMATARFGLEHFGRLFGRYPYRTLTIVHPPEGAGEAGGMEYPTLITTGGAWFLPLTGGRFAESVTMHEVAHQWFYGLVATDEHAAPFLDEGLASFAETEALEARFPGASALEPRLGIALGLPATHRVASLEVDANAPVAQPAPAFVTGEDYGALVYSRAAIIFLSLAGAYGDEAFGRALGVFTRRFRFKHPGPADLLDVVRESLGEPAAEALRAALYEPGSVDYLVEDFVATGSPPAAHVPGAPAGALPAPTEAGAPGAGHGYALVRRRGSVALPVVVDLIGEDGRVERVRWMARESFAALPYGGPSPLAAVVIDPEHRILLDADLSNNAARRGRSRVALRVLERAVFAAELGLLAAVP
jgi:hypothetical protein